MSKVLAIIGSGLLGLCLGMNANAGDLLKIGTFSVDVTPPPGSELWYGENEPVKFIVDPQEARGVVLLPPGQQPIVLCAVDWCAIGNGGWDAWREALAKAAGTIPERVAVHTLHQHSGMNCDFDSEAILETLGAGGQQFNGVFARDAIARVAAAVADAAGKARSVSHVGYGRGKVERVGSNVRIYNPDGTLRGLRLSSTPRDSAFAGQPEGLIDPDLRLVGFWDGSEPVAVMTYYACHPQTIYGDGRISAELPGFARRVREKETDAFHVHFNGAGGNITVGMYNTKEEGPANLSAIGIRLAEGMKRAWDEAQKTRVPIAPKMVSWAMEKVAYIPRALFNAEKLEKEIRSNPRGYDAIRKADELAWLRRLSKEGGEELACLHLGPVDILHMPGELYVEYQLAAQKMRPDRFVCVAAYGEYGPVYTATAMHFEQGGAGVLDVWMRPAPENEEVLRSAMARILNAEAYGRPKPAIPGDATPYVRAVLQDSPTAYFRFGEKTIGEGVRDSSGLELPPGHWYGPVGLGEPGAIAGDRDTCVRLDRATPSKCVFGEYSLAPIAVCDSFSVEIWARAPGKTFTNTCWFASQRTPNGFILGPSADGAEWSGYVCDAEGKHQMVGRHRPPAGTDFSRWHHYAMTYDAPADTGILYFDGVPVLTNRQTVLLYGKKRPPRSHINLTVGRDHRHPGAERNGEGWLDELAIYDKALPADRIAARHRLGKLPVAPVK